MAQQGAGPGGGGNAGQVMGMALAMAGGQQPHGSGMAMVAGGAQGEVRTRLKP